MNIIFSTDTALDQVILGWVEIANASVHESSESFRLTLQALIKTRAEASFPPESLKQAVRGMLRAGGFKPAGRQKPASEYLIQSACEGNFPVINSPVDCNNYVSLKTGLPISILDTRVTGDTVLIKIAKPGERYVFNAGGQEMDLGGLLCVCNKDGIPLGNPVKDSMFAKLKQDSTGFAGFIYIPGTLFDTCTARALAKEFAELLQKECGGIIKGYGSVQRKQ